MPLQPAALADLPQIVALESLPESRKYVRQWSEEQHARAFAGGNARYYVVRDNAGLLQAYAILRGFEESPSILELKRLVVAEPGHGLGRRILAQLLRMVFEDFNAHRFFLDVYEDNAPARHLYESVGFICEGTLREAAQRDGAWHSLILMSILEGEYRCRRT